MTLPVVLDRVVLDYQDYARNLYELSAVARKDGWSEWATELLGLAGIADRAARAEGADPKPAPFVICGICNGVRFCDITAHRAKGKRA